MSFKLANRIEIRDKYSNVDQLWGPYESVEQACEAISESRRERGLTVGIISNDNLEEYWWKLGTSDNDLVSKTSSIPKLEYVEDFPAGTIIRKELGETISVKVRFTSATYGQCTLTIYKDGSILKTVRTNKGNITLDLGKANSEGTSVYTITAVDALTIPAPEELSFKAVVGGAKISSDLQSLIDGGLNTSTDIQVTYNASVADTSKTVKVLLQIIKDDNVITSHTNIGSGDNSNTLSNQSWNIGALSESGNYKAYFSAYTGETPEDVSGDNVTKTVEYNFVLMDANDFVISSPSEAVSTDTNTVVSVQFRIYAGSSMVLRAHGVLLDSNNNEVDGYSLDRQVASNSLNSWALSKINLAGNYKIRLWATGVGGEEAPSGRVYIDIPVIIAQYIPNYAVVTDGLIAQFLADGKSNNNDSDTKGVWRNSVSNSPIYFALTDLNYNTNGWKHVDESIPDSEPAGEMMLKFSGNSYGVLKQRIGTAPSDSDPYYYPMSNLSSSEATGFTAEIIFRTRCVGELNAKVMTGHQGFGTNTAGFSASFEKITIGSSDAQVVLDVAEDEWIHATMVIDRTIHTDVDDVQNYAPKKLMTLYINGSACASAIITENMTFGNYGPVILNSAINTITGNIDFFGQCEIKAIRFYNKPLLASEVVNNYIASIYSEDEQNRVVGRNGDVLPIVKFINKNAQYPVTKKESDKGITLVNFETLNQMTEKAQQKKRYVHGDIVYKDTNDNEVIWQHAIIQTQGTSTLAFPVKNYKIKLYEDDFTTKVYTDAFSDKGWRDDYVYTLKCDYMEAAHLNNTPSCEFYNDLIDSLIESGTMKDGWNEDRTTYTASNDERSASRRDGNFDAIKGFPCLVYYYESEDDYYANNGTYVGTYMFNLDKAAESLGFDADAKKDTDGETAVLVSNPRYGIVEGENQYRNNICQSFEGVANGSDTAGCFYSYADWKVSFYHTYCEAAYTIYTKEGGIIDTLEDFIAYYQEHPAEKYRNGDAIPVKYDDNGYLVSLETYIQPIALGGNSPYEDEYAYLAADYEMRYDWDELEEGGSEFWGDSTWGLKRMIDWVSSASSTSGTQDDRFKAEFNDYFNFKYCAIYYLQMIVFGQVDNAGKNSMWDTWDGLHWHPRPYDLDTMAGLDNTGFEVIDPDAELIRELSPFLTYNNTTGQASYSEDIGDKANIRYRAYNTRTSKFWIAFATSFKTEIQALYKQLRDKKIYDINNIITKFVGKTSDIIGEVYYNRDMATKFYKLADIDTFISRMHGNRVQKFKSWITKRLVFCDTYFDYASPENSLNNNIIMRSDAVESNQTISISIGIKVYSPQYVRVDVGSGYDAKIEGYCSPDARYRDPITNEIKEGTLFTIPLPGGDKEIQISGGGNIRDIVNLGALKPKSLTLTYARKLINLDLSYSTKLLALSLSTNTYLQYLDCRGAIQLGTEASGAQLDLSRCVNLKYLYLDNTKLTSVVLPTGGSLKEISVKNTTITAINMNSLHFLTSVDVSGCDNILSYAITNCPRIVSLAADNLPLTSVSITNCTGLDSISLQGDTQISSLTINTCPNITKLYLTNNRSIAVKTIDLTTLYGLTTLNISGSTVERIKFPLKKGATSEESWGEYFTTLSMSGSDIKYIQYGEIVTTENDGVDMGQLTALSSLSFSNCLQIQHIYNLNYNGNCNSLFYNCKGLLDIHGKITCTGDGRSMFAYCTSLNNLDDTTFDFAACTTLVLAFGYCSYMPYSAIKKVLDSCGTALTNIDQICYAKRNGVTYTSSDTALTVLPANFFGNCKNVTSMNTSFYASGLTSIPIEAFKDSSGNPGLEKCTSFNIAFCSTNIASIPTNLMRFLPAATSIRGMFQGDSSVTTTLPANFFGTNSGDCAVTDCRGLFYGCSKLVVDISSMGNLLKPMNGLKDASLMFAGCTKCTGVIPEGFFANNASLTNIAGFFKDTRITGFPAEGSLFRLNGNTSSQLSSLKDISSLFEGCSTINDIIRSTLFTGANNITTAGIESFLVPTGGYITLQGLFYNCTGIISFSKDAFTCMPKLGNVSGLFRGCTGLLKQTESNVFDASCFNTHSYLTNVSYMFCNCSSLSITKVPQLFTASKNTITSVEGIFSGCSSISDFDSEIFTNMPKLQSAKESFKDCTSLSSIITDINPFDGCTNLQDVSGFFRGCTNLLGSVPVNMFNSCRKVLKTTKLMFYGCEELNGIISVGNEDTTSSEASNYQLGLLAECLSLTNTSYMFCNCKKLTGAIPWDIFYTESVEHLYTQLKDVSHMFHNCGFGTPTRYNDVDYFIHPDFFSKLIAITTTEGMFCRDSNIGTKWTSVYPIAPTTFNGQYFLTTIREMFRRCYELGGAVTNSWFSNSLSSINNCYGAFAYTKITNVDNLFLRASSESANTKITNVGKMFFGCTEVQHLPPCNSTAAFSRINYSDVENCIVGFAYNCTRADNYNTFTGAWIESRTY